MRKHSPRKWLHAVLDLLPVILIPVFMIYSHRHTLTDVTTVDLQYKYQSNEVNSIDDLIVGNIYELDINNYTIDDFVYSQEWVIFQLLDDLELKYDELEINDSTIDFDKITSNTILQLENDNNSLHIYTYYSYEQYENLSATNIYNYDVTFSSNCIIKLIDFNLTSYQVFNYTDYNEIESVQVNDETSSVTDVFIDNFTNTVNTKFNFAQMFNFNDIWSWLNTNLFNNISSPLAYAIYNIIIYEFLMDILFIIYALFMFIIDFCECLLEKPFDKVKRG